MVEAIRDLASLWTGTDYPVFGDRWVEISRLLVEGLDVQGKDVLDVGTGPGATAIEAAARGGRRPASTTRSRYWPLPSGVLRRPASRSTGA